MRFILRMLITATVAYGLSKLLDGVHIRSFGTAIGFVLILGLLNAFVKPLLILLTLPITLFTLGLFLLVINVLMIYLAASFFPGVHIDGFMWALLFGVLLSILSGILTKMEKKEHE
jgi:putative membrane protein